MVQSQSASVVKTGRRWERSSCRDLSASNPCLTSLILLLILLAASSSSSADNLGEFLVCLFFLVSGILVAFGSRGRVDDDGANHLVRVCVVRLCVCVCVARYLKTFLVMSARVGRRETVRAESFVGG